MYHCCSLIERAAVHAAHPSQLRTRPSRQRCPLHAATVATKRVSVWLPCADGTGLSFAAVQGILAGCIVAVVACLAVTALLVYLCARRAARLRGVRPPALRKLLSRTVILYIRDKMLSWFLAYLAGKQMMHSAIYACAYACHGCHGGVQRPPGTQHAVNGRHYICSCFICPQPCISQRA